jgi:hypothetical protein
MDGENLLTQPFWYVERVEITKNGRHPDGRNIINQLDEKTKVLFRLENEMGFPLGVWIK